MYNTLEDLKKKLPFKGTDVDLSDIEPLGTGKTPYEEWLEDCCEQSEVLVNSWELSLANVTETRKKRAEINIVIALTIENLTFQDTNDAQTIQLAGMEMRTFKKLSAEERGRHVQTFIDRAYEILSGRKPSYYIGIE